MITITNKNSKDKKNFFFILDHKDRYNGDIYRDGLVWRVKWGQLHRGEFASKKAAFDWAYENL